MKKLVLDPEKYRAPVNEQEALEYITTHREYVVEDNRGKLWNCRSNGKLKTFVKSGSWRKPVKHGLYECFSISYINGITQQSGDHPWEFLRIAKGE